MLTLNLYHHDHSGRNGFWLLIFELQIVETTRTLGGCTSRDVAHDCVTLRVALS